MRRLFHGETNMTIRNAGRTAFAALMIVAAAACGGGADDDASTASTDTSTVAPPAATATTTDAGATPPAGAAGALPDGVTPAMVAAGETAFKTGPCFACHGADATGTPMAPNLTDNVWLNATTGSYDEIKTVIKTGVPTPKDPAHAAPMPAMGGAQLTDQQINELAAYVYSLSHKG